MAQTPIHVGDIGATLQYQFTDSSGNVVDVSTATTLQMTIVRSDASRLTVTASFVTNGKDGLLQYLTQTGDLSVAGMYTLQVYVSWGASKSLHGNIQMFQVWPNE